VLCHGFFFSHSFTPVLIWSTPAYLRASRSPPPLRGKKPQLAPSTTPYASINRRLLRSTDQSNKSQGSIHFTIEEIPLFRIKFSSAWRCVDFGGAASHGTNPTHSMTTTNQSHRRLSRWLRGFHCYHPGTSASPWQSNNAARSKQKSTQMAKGHPRTGNSHISQLSSACTWPQWVFHKLRMPWSIRRSRSKVTQL
jgi:hypothetical protein